MDGDLVLSRAVRRWFSMSKIFIFAAVFLGLSVPALTQPLRLLSMWRHVDDDGFALSPCTDAGCVSFHASKSKQSWFASPPGVLDDSIVGHKLVLSIRIDNTNSDALKAARASSSSSSSSISGWQILPDIILDWGSGSFVHYMAFQPQLGLQQVKN